MSTKVTIVAENAKYVACKTCGHSPPPALPGFSLHADVHDLDGVFLEIERWSCMYDEGHADRTIHIPWEIWRRITTPEVLAQVAQTEGWAKMERAAREHHAQAHPITPMPWQNGVPSAGAGAPLLVPQLLTEHDEIAGSMTLIVCSRCERALFACECPPETL